jgi:hypothetical protein
LTAYHDDFIERYVLCVRYPGRLTRVTELLLGGIALAVNAFVYWRVYRQRTIDRHRERGDQIPTAALRVLGGGQHRGLSLGWQVSPLAK